MPNGGDLDRPFIVLGAFHRMFGHWPTRLRCDEEHYNRLRNVFSHAFAEGDWTRAERRLVIQLVAGEHPEEESETLRPPRSWQAVDDDGNQLDYVEALENEILSELTPAAEVHAWLGIHRREDW